jgi:phage repressor protein C with HTH and peptisase S24 domain
MAFPDTPHCPECLLAVHIASLIIVLYSANPAYKPRRFSGPELEDIRIAGRVVACYHKV